MIVTDERKRTVEAGYDALADGFGEWMARVEGDPWERFVDELADRLPDGARALDLGCGNGAKTSRLAGRFELTGVDISERQLELARAGAPGASFFQADFTEVGLRAESFDAVTALYSIVHVPREEQPALFARILGWLKPGGLFLASLSHVGGEDRVDDWLGVDMFFSGFDADTNRRLVREAGFELLVDDLVWMREPESEVAFLWVLARKPE
jgi:SAM-dependent methyltransferase